MFRPTFGSVSVCLGLLICSLTGCGSGTGGALAPAGNATASSAGLTTVAPGLPILAAPGADGGGSDRSTSSVLVPLQPSKTAIEFGAVDGTTVVARASGSTWGFSEDFAVMFPGAISPTLYTATTVPASTSGAQIIVPVEVDNPTISSRNLLEVRWSKAPGVSYTVTIHQGATVVATAVVNTSSSMATPPPPILSKAGDPYYYGSLEHDAAYPFGIKLAGNSSDIDPRALAALTAQHVHFIRYGPAPNELALNTTGVQSRQSYAFASVDPTLATLHQNNITALYQIQAAPAPAWGNRNATGDAMPIFETPALYAEYCGTVAAHLAATSPWVTRVEIGTNEPNFAANWQNSQAVADGMPQYADATGYGFALYAKACYSAIKAVAPNISVVAPGVTIASGAYQSFAFIDHMYASGCRVGTCFDMLGVHSYTWFNPGWTYDQKFMDSVFGPGAGPGTLMSYRTIQNHAVADGETSMPPIMITEMGYSSYTADPLGVQPQLQAFYMAEAFNMYLSDPTVKGVVWADIVNHETTPSLFSGISTLDQNNNPKPAWYTYKTFATY